MDRSFVAAELHAGQPVHEWGVPLNEAHAVLILLHGRGGSAQDMESLMDAVAGFGVAGLAPEARYNSWYPQRFIAPLEANEPWLSSALEVVGGLVARAKAANVPRERVIVLGFSQGACLALEYAARNPARYGGVIGLSGGLIGPEGAPFDHPGDFAGAPVFLGVSDNDPHIPLGRVEESVAAFERMGAAVTARLYPATGHQVVADEIDFVRKLVLQVASTSR
ncbi:MAG TPA: dienelactone hydrolase family protein [Candidatus Limnocylindrales bacterium]|nr:dienelactone hydrolase family protein [Candidatus Limnocylindrales bacterium]